MKRKTKLGVALTLLFTPHALSMEGLYAGISMGTSNAQADINRTTKFHFSSTSNAGMSGKNIGAFLGYNHLIEQTPLFIGLETGINSHNLNISLNKDHGVLFSERMIINTKYSMSGLFKFGVVVKDLMIYAKAGIFRSQWRFNLKGRHPNGRTFASLIKSNSYGSIHGFGADYKMNDKWSIGIDHSINTCQTLNLDFNELAGAAKIDPMISTTSMRLTYTF